MEFGSRFRFGQCGASYMDKPMMFGAPKRISFGAKGSEFGRRKPATKKISKASAMKAFKAFYRRHCTSSMGRSRSRFGNGGNPPLYQSMGYEFCPLGSGGVLGSNSTGLFPSPCHSVNVKEAALERNVMLPKRYGGADKKKAATAFGKKRRVVRRKAMEFGRR